MAKQHPHQQQQPEHSAVATFLATADKMLDVAIPKLAAVMNDIRRRCVEEPWFGKPVFDVLYNANQRAAAGQRDRPVEEDQQRETEGTAYQHDYNPTGFYRTQDKDAEQQQARGREDEHGMER